MKLLYMQSLVYEIGISSRYVIVYKDQEERI
jgi:hypothetical protein